jgi:hypothetical protein
MGFDDQSHDEPPNYGQIRILALAIKSRLPPLWFALLPYGPRVLMTVHGIEPVHRCYHYFIPNIADVLADLNQ